MIANRFTEAFTNVPLFRHNNEVLLKLIIGISALLNTDRICRSLEHFGAVAQIILSLN